MHWPNSSSNPSGNGARTWRYYLPYVAATLGLIGLIVLYVFEFRWFNRTLEGGKLARNAAILGALIGAALGYRWRRQAGDLTEKVQLYVFFIFLFALFAPLFASLSNRLLSFRPPAATQVEFFDETAFYASAYGLIEGEKPEPTGYHLFFYLDDQLFRIRNDAAAFPDAEPGHSIQLPVRTGLWGFRYVPPLD